VDLLKVPHLKGKGPALPTNIRLAWKPAREKHSTYFCLGVSDKKLWKTLVSGWESKLDTLDIFFIHTNLKFTLPAAVAQWQNIWLLILRSLSKSKCWYSNNCLHFLKCAAPAMTLSITTFSITTLRIIGLFATLNKIDTQPKWLSA
jgi:hypothetical protein